MEFFINILNNHLEEIAIFFIIFSILIGFKMILSSFKMPQYYQENKKVEQSVVNRILRTRQLDDAEKIKRLKDIFR